MMRGLTGAEDAMNEKCAKIEAAVNEITAGMTEEQLRFHTPGRWASADILEHLALTYGGTAKAFEKRLAEGPQGGNPSLKQRIGHLLVLELGIFPFKRKSPKPVEPKGDLSGKEAMELLRRNLKEMDAAFEAYVAKHGAAGRVANHPILGPLTYEQWLKFHLNHGLHHVKQIRLLKAAAARELRAN